MSKVAVVAGYGPAIGAAFAKRFGAAGYSLALLSLAETMPETAAAGRGHACQLPGPAAPTHGISTTANQAYVMVQHTLLHNPPAAGLVHVSNLQWWHRCPCRTHQGGHDCQRLHSGSVRPCSRQSSNLYHTKRPGPHQPAVLEPGGAVCSLPDCHASRNHQRLQHNRDRWVGGWGWRPGAAATVGGLYWAVCETCQATSLLPQYTCRGRTIQHVF
jgi:hypothetical protein